jgi:endogenous inhibitor of DNA gyrase (YacG/DUF329 family)
MTSGNGKSAKSRVAVHKCPICGTPSIDTFKPFCSKRCADRDLARWLGGNYAIAGHADAEEDEMPSSASRQDGPETGEH